MRTIFSNLTASLLLIHSLIGCCWHHAHEAAEGADLAAPTLVAHACCAHDGSDGIHNSVSHRDGICGESPDGPCRCVVECHETCIYLPPQKTELDACATVFPLDLAIENPTQCHERLAAAYGTHVSSALSWDRPVRLHLWHRIMLI